MGAFIHSSLFVSKWAAWTELLLRGQEPHGPAVDVLRRKVRASGNTAARECLADAPQQRAVSGQPE